MKKSITYLTALACLSPKFALAGAIMPAPIPVAGIAGPVGVGVAIGAYVGYRVWTRNR